MSRNVALGQPTVGEEELAAVAAVFSSGWLSGAGPACLAFEKDFAGVAGVDNVLATSNCGTALHLALLTLGAGPGDEVIVGDYTFPATGHAVTWTGAKPVFADIRPDIWSVDPAAVEAAITPRTVGIIAVDVFGQPADYDELRAIADKHGLWLIEDAACARAPRTRGGLRAASPTPPRSASTAARASLPARAARSSAPRGPVDHARKLHTYGIAPAIVRDGICRPAGPDVRRARLQLPALRRSPRPSCACRSSGSRSSSRPVPRRGLVPGAARRRRGTDLPVVLDDRTHPWQSYVITLAPGSTVARLRSLCASGAWDATSARTPSHVQPVYGRASPALSRPTFSSRHLAIPMHANLDRGRRRVRRAGRAGRHRAADVVSLSIFAATPTLDVIVTPTPRTTHHKESSSTSEQYRILHRRGRLHRPSRRRPCFSERGLQASGSSTTCSAATATRWTKLAQNGRRRAHRPGHPLRRGRPRGDEGLRATWCTLLRSRSTRARPTRTSRWTST